MEEKKTAGMFDASSLPAGTRSGLLSSRVTSVTLFVTILLRGMTSIWKTVVASSCVGWSARQPCPQGGQPWKHSLDAGPGPGLACYKGVPLSWIWPPGPCATVARSGSLPPSPMSR
jgi:hypothetical protein